MIWMLIGIFLGVWIDQSFDSIPRVQNIIDQAFKASRESSYINQWGAQEKTSDTDNSEEEEDE